MATFAEQIAAYEAARAAKAAEIKSLMDASGEGGETLNAEDQEAFDTLDSEIEAIDKHLARLRKAQKLDAETAKPVDGSSAKSAGESRTPTVAARVKAPKAEPGVQFARFARCLILGKKTGSGAMAVAKELYGDRDPEVLDMVQKAAVSAINTTTDAALIGHVGGIADYVEYLRNQTIVGRFGQGGIPNLRRVPFYYPVVTQATGGTAYWQGEGAAKPLTRPTWAESELTPMQVVGLAAVTLKALKFSTPDADLALRDDLTAAVVAAIDAAFIDPANAGTASKPASIGNGITGTAASVGGDADGIRTDAKAAMKAFVQANNPLTSGVWIMSGTNALGASMLNNPLGQPEFPDLGPNGGTFYKLPVIVSQAAGSTVTLVNASDVWLADEGGVNVDTSTEASLEMADNPTGSAVTPTGASLVSMFQTNSMAIRVEKMINWKRRRPTGVATITAADWGEAE